jgi:hypothetical protein
MSDLTNRLRKGFDFLCRENQIDSYQAISNEAADKIDGLDVGWISVKDQLPENDDSVIVYWPENLGYEMVLDFIEDGCWFVWDQLDESTTAPYTHWMHLPKPPATLLN